MSLYREFMIAIRRLRYISHRIRNVTDEPQILDHYMRFSERRRVQECMTILRNCLLDPAMCPRLAAIGMIRIDTMGYDLQRLINMHSSDDNPGFNWFNHYHDLPVKLDIARIGDYLADFDNLLGLKPKAMESRLALFKLSLT